MIERANGIRGDPERASDPQSADASSPRTWEPEAGDVLCGAVRDPVPPFTAEWYTVDGGDRTDLNALLPIATAWMHIDPARAASLVRSALDLCGTDGQLARYAAAGADPSSASSVSDLPAWPLLARAAWRTGAAGADPNPEDFLQRLGGYLGWAVRAFDPSVSGQPRWPCDAAAFIPDTWDDDLLPVDLVSFLLAEFEAYDALQSDLGISLEDDRRIPAGYRDLLSEHLLFFLWDARRHRFCDRYRSGKRTARITLSSLCPLLWSGLPSAPYDAARRQCRPSAPLTTPRGLLLWEPWPEDPVPPPTPMLQQAVVFDALCASGLSVERAHVGRLLRERLMSCIGSTSEGVAEALPEEGSPPVVAAALVIRVGAAGDSARPGSPNSGLVPWLDRNTRLILWSMTALVVFVAVLILAAPRLFPRSGDGPSIEALGGLAQNHYARGRFDEAERMYADILARSELPVVAYQLGNTQFRQGKYAEAEENYRAAMASPEIEVRARYNLAQALLRQGHNEEAGDHLRQIVAIHSREYPEVSRLAGRTIGLLEVNESP